VDTGIDRFGGRAMDWSLELPPFLTRRDDGEIAVTGTRITLHHVLWHYRDGESAEDLAADYPSLHSPIVHKLIAYHLENRPEVDRYLAAYQSELDRQRSASPSASLPRAESHSPALGRFGNRSGFKNAAASRPGHANGYPACRSSGALGAGCVATSAICSRRRARRRAPT
jgi:uncharacterized protein (DUF433 family)